MSVLVCGGAGYIGSHTVRALIEAGYEVVIYDNLSKGHIASVPRDVRLYVGDLRDPKALERVFENEHIEGVIDFAADSLVGESVKEPLKYFDNNVYGTVCLLKMMNKYQVRHIVFSSTAATYGEPEKTPILESDKTEPTNPYGESKRTVEKVLKWSQNAYGLTYTALRYFNAAGAYRSGEIGEDHNPETHLIPLILQVALGQRKEIMIFGDDYPTPDGSCLRDYIHVSDLATAHILALKRLMDGGDSRIYNLGNGKGFSVKEMVEAARGVTGHAIPAKTIERRPGDPAILIASSQKAKEELGWIPAINNVEDIIASAWQWHQAHPQGYDDQGSEKQKMQTLELTKINQEKTRLIEELMDFGQSHQMLKVSDRPLVRNDLMQILHMETAEDSVMENHQIKNMETALPILEKLLGIAVDEHIIEDTVVERDLLDSQIMGCLMPRPSTIEANFENLLEQKSPEAATDYFYNLSQDANYIRTDRIAKNKYWQATTPYGNLEITINRSKPEKDPRSIAKAKELKSTGYPKCLLCLENEGYKGRLNHPGRSNHRVVGLTLNQEKWYLQYSPYVYYNEHCIVFNQKHIPMHIDRSSFVKIFDFLDLLPHYFVGSNADLPIVGGSILSHDHFQGGHHTFPMETAPVICPIHMPADSQLRVGVVKWPLSVVRVSSYNKEELIDFADHILKDWRKYSDPERDIFAFTEENGKKIPHNTITPIGRIKEGTYELDLVLRNNRTSQEHPLGIFHPHKELHHIKKENIGLIEVMGLAVLPARLEHELDLAEKILMDKKLPEKWPEDLKKHKSWIEQMLEDLKTKPMMDRNSIHDYLQDEVGNKFAKVLECAGVYKQNEKGLEGIVAFVESVVETYRQKETLQV